MQATHRRANNIAIFLAIPLIRHYVIDLNSIIPRVVILTAHELIFRFEPELLMNQSIDTLATKTEIKCQGEYQVPDENTKYMLERTALC